MMTPRQQAVYQYLSARPDLINTEVYAHPGIEADTGLTRAEFFAVCAELHDAGKIRWQHLGGVRYTFRL